RLRTFINSISNSNSNSNSKPDSNSFSDLRIHLNLAFSLSASAAPICLHLVVNAEEASLLSLQHTAERNKDWCCSNIRTILLQLGPDKAVDCGHSALY